MKKILLALTVIGTIHYSADAQNKTKQNYNQNYQVCKANDAYTICGEKPTAATMTPAGTDVNLNDLTASAAPSQSVQENQVKAYEGYYQQHNIMVSYDDPRNPYEGLPSKQDDGPMKNDVRNLNYGPSSTNLPPVNGD